MGYKLHSANNAIAQTPYKLYAILGNVSKYAINLALHLVKCSTLGSWTNPQPRGYYKTSNMNIRNPVVYVSNVRCRSSFHLMFSSAIQACSSPDRFFFFQNKFTVFKIVQASSPLTQWKQERVWQTSV